jgi:hypothetical protein
MRLALTTALLLLAPPAMAGEADVIDARATALGGGQWRIEATIRHADTGWDHYANAFEILGPDGAVLGTRVLHHPHVEEQPFTRSHTVAIPAEVTTITIRAVDSVHATGGAEVTITLE